MSFEAIGRNLGGLVGGVGGGVGGAAVGGAAGAGAGAVEGGVGGLAIGAVTGPGAIATGLAGATAGGVVEGGAGAVVGGVAGAGAGAAAGWTLGGLWGRRLDHWIAQMSVADHKADEHPDQPTDGCAGQCEQSTPADPNQTPPDENEEEKKKRRDQQLQDAADMPDRGGLTKAGRALAKHGGRPGSAFPRATGSPTQINQQGKAIVDDILSNPKSTTTTETTGRYGQTTEVRAPDGRGLRYSGNGEDFIGFLEP